MSAVNEWVVREYFELQGFLVLQPRKYTVPARPKKAEEEFDLLVLNPRAAEQTLPADLVWSTQALQSVACAVVGIRGWHTERFYASTFEQAPDILRFAEPDALERAAAQLGRSDMAKVLCLPRLPASGPIRARTLEVLAAKGIDGVLGFDVMLRELIRQADVKCNYDKSDLLQVIRLLKNYDLLRDPQLDLFEKKRRRRKAQASSSTKA